MMKNIELIGTCTRVLKIHAASLPEESAPVVQDGIERCVSPSCPFSIDNRRPTTLEQWRHALMYAMNWDNKTVNWWQEVEKKQLQYAIGCYTNKSYKVSDV
jgi:hypothetical protein